MRKKQQTPQETLSREQIVQAAIYLLDQAGYQGFTMRRLSGHLGVGTTTLYWYISSKDEVLEHAADEILGEITYSGEAQDWLDKIVSLCLEYHQVILRHPWIVQLFGSFSPIGPHSLCYLDQLYCALQEGGFHEQKAVEYLQIIFHYVIGSSIMEVATKKQKKHQGILGAKAVQAYLQTTEELNSFPYLFQYLLGKKDQESSFVNHLKHLLDSMNSDNR
ncbi:transcriptional regulator, TetR family [Seinonella peptonophila]|uniref:Transcriptional regulator, TetR family n=1 Tax=Seinonella peptonophila TaxID=112248 RepID=A0A1M4W6R5_9BACL|nr:TetR/AcrR family transcriptional regulator [Seinonella peptonophila]SHE76948.1 transcriptional regulator, TetR family [Seinonella peptonophila]